MDEHRKIELRYRLKGLARELPARLAGVSLAPFSPRAAAPAEPVRSCGLQELAGLRREIQDDFARARLELADLSERLTSFGPAVPGRPAAARREDPPPGSDLPGPEELPLPVPLEQDLTAPPASRSRYLALAALLALCAGVVLYLASVAGGPRVYAYPLPHQSAVGLSRGSGESLIYADPKRQLLFTVSGRDGKVLAVQNFRVPALAGLASDGESVWTYGFNGLGRHDLSGVGPEKYYPVAGSAPGPLYWDGKYLWAASPAEASLARYLPGETLFLSGRYPAPPLLGAGFVAAGEDLYAVNPLPPALCRYKVEGEMALSAKAPLGPFLRPGSKIAAFTMDKTWLWLVTENPSELRRVSLAGLEFGEASD